jgi:hypothetical protein
MRSRFRIISVLVIAVLLPACDRLNLPEYWLCSGSARQSLFDKNGLLIESYEGRDPLMLEFWGNHIYQFLQGSFSGQYEVCQQAVGSSSSMVIFQSNGCMEKTVHGRSGSLNLSTGDLVIKESRYDGGRLILNEGRYQCRKKGRTFNFSEFNHV